MNKAATEKEKKYKVLYDGGTGLQDEELPESELLEEVKGATIGDEGFDPPIVQDQHRDIYEVQVKFSLVKLSKEEAAKRADRLGVCAKHWEYDCEKCEGA